MTTIKRMLLLATAVSACASAALAQSEWTTGTISYDGAGNIVAMGQDVYLYDSAGRLVRGTANQQQSGGVTARQEYSYDAYGNRLNVTTTGTTCVGGCASSVSVDATTNRVSGATYDAAGNMTAVGASSYTSDGAGMMSHLTSGTTIDWQFVYTAEDERLATYTGQGTWNFTVRDVDAKVLREVTAYQGSSGTTWTWSLDHVFRDDFVLASVYPSGQREQFHIDHLGTPRVVTDANGVRIGTHAYYQFGDELALNSDESPLQRLKFTGHERDSLGSRVPVDYMHARYYSPISARFLSIDPLIPKEAMRAPLLWNRYAYVGNNPVNRVDPSGRLLRIAACAHGPNDSCTAAFNLYLSTFGKQSQEAAKYLQVGKNGIVNITGMSGAAFAKQFGIMGRATMLLTGIRSSVFSIEVGRTKMTDAHGGGACDCYVGPNRPIGVDPSAGTRKLQGADVGPTETLVHEIGHAVASLYPGFAYQLGLVKWRSNLVVFDGNYESYATAFENVWRHSVLGDPNPRSGYAVGMDQYDTTDINQLFPPGVFK